MEQALRILSALRAEVSASTAASSTAPKRKTQKKISGVGFGGSRDSDAAAALRQVQQRAAESRLVDGSAESACAEMLRCLQGAGDLGPAAAADLIGQSADLLWVLREWLRIDCLVEVSSREGVFRCGVRAAQLAQDLCTLSLMSLMLEYAELYSI